MTPEEMSRRLGEISEYKGVAYGRAHLLFDEEQKHCQAILKFQGYLALSDALKCFYLETVELMNTECRPKVITPLSEFYGLFLSRLVHSFQSLFGSERLAINGYPYHAYTILRNTFDNLTLVSAALQKMTDYYSIEGIEPGKPFDADGARKLRKKTEFFVKSQMMGNQSGLTQATIDELALWDAMFDYEIHGARLSLAASQEWLRGESPLPALPTYREQAFAMFMNRFAEISWIALRLLPLIQPPEVCFSAPWKNKWQFLDTACEEMVEAPSKQLGKKIGAAMVEFVKAKFPFSHSTTFPL